MHRPLRVTGAFVTALTWATLSIGSALATSPSPSSSPAPTHGNGEVTITARALLGGHVRPGAWAAVDAEITNSGPAVTGELRIRGQREGRSQYGIVAELPTGAHQRYTLYAQTAFFGRSVLVDFVSGEQVIASQTVQIQSHDAYSPIVAVIAERPEGLLGPIRDAMANPNVTQATIITLRPADLPARVEAWAPIDRLVWQDVDAAQLTEAQLKALKLWIGAGGRLTILGGTTGFATVGGFGPDLLPFEPSRTIDAAAADIASLVGQAPAGAAPVPALAGTLLRGTVLARVGDDVIAAEAATGRGVVTLLGFSPTTTWIADGDAADQLWRRLLPQESGPALNPLTLPDDSQIMYALQNLPAIALPPIEQLFALLLAYIALVGPINYLVLRRLDKREWAWVTIPALVGIFAVGSYGLGATLKGSDVIINEIAVVRGAQGSDQGIGQVYVGIYSPSRRTFEVRIPGGALISNPTSQAQQGQTETPLDVLFGESISRLRNFEVGFGVLRGFRAEAPAVAPLIEADLRLSAGKLLGTVVNRSQTALENVAIVFAGGVEVLPTIGAGETKDIELDVTGSSALGYGLSERIFGSTFPRDPAQARAVSTRRAVLDQLFPYGTTANPDAPLLLAWRPGAVLDVELPGDEPNRVGEGLFMIPLAMRMDAQQVFTAQAMRRTIVESTAAQGWGDSSGLYLSRGTMIVETSPPRFDGSFVATSLELALTQAEMRALRGDGQPLAPLPDAQQPDQDDPVADPPEDQPEPSATPAPTDGGGAVPGGVDQPAPPKPGDPALRFEMLPSFQLWDRTTQRWVEFAHPEASESYVIQDPERYVDPSGSVRLRFVNRNDAGQFGEESAYFQLLLRIEGTIE